LVTGLERTLPPLVYPTKSVYYAASAKEGQARMPLCGLAKGINSARIRILLARNAKLLANLIPNLREDSTKVLRLSALKRTAG
jgi:hypothetical protein